MLNLAPERTAAQLGQEFVDTGHIYVPNVYDPNIADVLESEIDDLFRHKTGESRVLGEQLKGMRSPLLSPNYHGNIFKVLGEIGNIGAQIFGDSFALNQDNPNLLLNTVDMFPRVDTDRTTGEKTITPVIGKWHCDEPYVIGPSAITTYKYSSRLEFVHDPDENHELLPGGVAFFDPHRFHRGVANKPRRALMATIIE